MKEQSTRTSFKVHFYAQHHKLNRRGRAPIMCRITVNGVGVGMSARCDVDMERWNGIWSQTPGVTKDDKLINSTLNELRSVIHAKYYEMLTRGDVITAQKLKNAMTSKDERSMGFLELCDMFNADYAKQVGKTTTHKTYGRYLRTRVLLAEFLAVKSRKGDIPISDVNIKFIRDFESHLYSTTIYQNNYVVKFIQRLRTIFNLARNNGWVVGDPFAFYKFHFESTDRGYLTDEELHAIADHQFESKSLTFIRDMFLFSCYTGLAYIDLRNLTKDSIVEDEQGALCLVTKRQKTGVPVKMKLLDVPVGILIRYKEQSATDKVFVIPTNQKVNEYLKAVADLCGIEKKVTFHLARHTFATTITLLNGVPIETVSKLLGHTNIRTTQIYARVTDTKIDRDMDMLAIKLNSAQQLRAAAAQ